jgi:1-phosphofructokinase
MNAAIDIFIETDDLIPKIVNRSKRQDIQPNGKAVNISFILKMLGIDSIATGFSAGFTGRFIEEELEKKGIKTDFVHTSGITRLNVFTNVINQNTEYKLVNPGPYVNQKEIDAMLEKISALKKGDILCVSGSLPKGVEPNIYIQIAHLAKKNNFDLVLDISSDIILDCLFCLPLILKPNIDELAQWFGKKNIDKQEAVKYAKELVLKGARNVIVSLGADGALYLDKKIGLYTNAPEGKVVNTACAGDAMLGAFLAGLIENKPIDENLKFAVCAGSSTAFRAGLTDFSDIPDLIKNIKTADIKS